MGRQIAFCGRVTNWHPPSGLCAPGPRSRDMLRDNLSVRSVDFLLTYNILSKERANLSKTKKLLNCTVCNKSNYANSTTK